MTDQTAIKPSEATLAVVIPAYNAGHTLEACLAAIARSHRQPDEVILFDDGSTDGTAEIARRHGARVLAAADGANGPAFGRNAGAQATRAPILVFIDADVVVHPDAIGLLERPILDNEAVAAFGFFLRFPAAIAAGGGILL